MRSKLTGIGAGFVGRTLGHRPPEAASARVQFEITKDDAPRGTLSSGLRSAGVDPVRAARPCVDDREVVAAPLHLRETKH